MWSLLALVACTWFAVADSAKVQPPPPQKLTVLITGASTGIGKSTALEFAKNDKYRVYATMRDPSVWDLPAQDNIVVSSMDVTSDDSVQRAVGAMIDAEGHIDIVVNNAGYAVVGCLEAVTIEEAKAEFEVNVWGVVRVLQAVLPHMRAARRGHIINLRYTRHHCVRIIIYHCATPSYIVMKQFYGGH